MDPFPKTSPLFEDVEARRVPAGRILAARNFLQLLLVMLGCAHSPIQAQTPGGSTGILREVFTGIPGSTLADLTNSAAFSTRPASTNVIRDFFEAPSDFEDDYGQRLRAYLLPPFSGNYVFWISSDDQSALFLSTNDDPANRVQIAQVDAWTSSREWDSEPGQQSAPVRLEAGRRYYIEALMKEGSGGDNLAVRWQLPDGSIEEPIPASRCLLFGSAIVAPRIRSQPTDLEVVEGDSAAFTVELRTATPAAYQWEKNRLPILGANGQFYTNLAVSLGDNGSAYRVVVTNTEGSVTSSEAVLKVRPDMVAPFIRSVVNVGSDRIRVRFSESVANASRVPNYQLNLGASVIGAAYEDSRTVLLSTTPLGLRTVYQLAVNGITDLASARNPIAPGSFAEFAVLELTPAEIGQSQLPGSILPSPGGFLVRATGQGIRNSGDELFFSHRERLGDFDVKVRVSSFTSSDGWAKAGLMARDNLGTNSRFAAALTTPGTHGSFYAHRDQPGAIVNFAGFHPVNYPETWLRLRRSVDQFSAFASFDGLNWSLLGTSSIRMTNRVFLGIAIASNSTNDPVTVDLRDFRSATDSLSESSGFVTDGEVPGPSSRNTSLVISEIMYHPAPRPDGRNLEFIELFNSGVIAENLSGCRLSGSIDFVFPEGTSIPSGAFLVVAPRPADIRDIYGIENVIGGFESRLGNSSGSVHFLSRSGAVLLKAAYSGVAPFPIAADGAGHSLVLRRPSYGESDPRAWSASSRIGGSPGRAERLVPDPMAGLKINEILAHTDDPELDFVEIYNSGKTSLDLSGFILTDDPGQARFRCPSGTRLAPGAFAVFRQDLLGFSLNAAGESVFLLHSDGSRVIDAVRFGAQLNGVSWGRTPDGSDNFALLESKTPASANSIRRHSPVVINEIFYQPPSGDSRETFIELLNSSDRQVDLSNWELTKGVSFKFQPGTLIPAGGFLVVAREADFLKSVQTNLNPAQVLGNFSGTLSSRGETIALVQPEQIVSTNSAGRFITNHVLVEMESFSYRTGGRWGRWSNGGGSSLERIHPSSDPSQPSSWADSTDVSRAPWSIVEKTGVLDNASTRFQADSIQVLLMGEGECLVDQIEVRIGQGPNLVPNGSFEAGMTSWVPRGTHATSTVVKEGFASQSSLHLVASARGDTGPNQIFAPLNEVVPLGALATIRARVRWLRGNPEILFRLHGNGLEAAGRMEVPPGGGTPGLRNTAAVLNPGPTISEVTHHPILPAPFEPVRITARVADPDRVQSVTLLYRLDPAVTIQRTNMVDNGTSGDQLAGDGVYTVTIPGQAAGVLLAFSIESQDSSSPRATSRFPSSAPEREALVLFGDTTHPGGLGDYHIWFTQATEDRWIARGPGSNDPFDMTFVYGNGRVIYNANVLYSGSPFHWTGYGGPLAGNCNYLMHFFDDEPFLGAADLVLNSPSNLGNDNTAQREQTFYWIIDQLGQPVAHRRYHYLYVNGIQRGNPASDFLFEDAQQPNGDFVKTWFPKEADGELFKIEDWFEYDAAGFSFQNVDASLEQFLTTGMAKKQERYRWAWRKRSTGPGESAHDYSSLFDLVDTVNEPDLTRYTERVERTVDVGQWMNAIAMRHLAGDWDAYGYRRGKNMYAYKPSDGRWRLLHWDIAFGFGQGDGPTTDMFATIEPVIRRMLQHPPFRRLYLQALQRAVSGPLDPARIEPVLDARYSALSGGGATISSPASVKNFIKTRRTFLTQLLNSNQAPFSVDGPASGLSTNRNLIEISGTAPLPIRDLLVGGQLLPVQWRSVSNWVARVVLQPGDNLLTIRGIDLDGKPAPAGPVELRIRYNSTTPETNPQIVFSEIQWNNSADGGEFIELYNTSGVLAADLSRWRVDGASVSLPDGTILPPNGFLVIPADPGRFLAAFGDRIPVAGFIGNRLAASGQSLRLIRPSNGVGAETVVDQAFYQSLFPWPNVGETGFSLQRVFPLMDGRRPIAWASGSTSGAGDWIYVSASGLAGSSSGLQISLSLAGEVLLDDLNLVEGAIPGQGRNLIANPGFEEGVSQFWSYDPDYIGSTQTGAGAFSGTTSLRLKFTPTSGTIGFVSQQINPPLIKGRLYTLSFWCRPLRGGGILSIGLSGSSLHTTQQLIQSDLSRSTPGFASNLSTSISPAPPIILNEFLGANRSGIVDATGTRHPWIEIHNPSLQPASTHGLYLSIAAPYGSEAVPESSPSIWIFPDLVLNPGEFRLIWVGGNANGELHANLDVPPAGGRVLLGRLSDTSQEILDVLDFSRTLPDSSVGRIPDGDLGGSTSLAIPTPGRSNVSAVSSGLVVINEWMASNTRTLADPDTGSHSDWIELYNAGTSLVDLSGWRLSDDLSNNGKWFFPSGTSLGSHAFLLVWADGGAASSSASAALHASFKLSQSGEEIGLFDGHGFLVDSVKFTQQADDVSFGRYPDGAGAPVIAFPNPTPRQPNMIGPKPPSGLRIESLQVDQFGGISLFLQSTLNGRYQLQYSASLENPVWLPLGAEMLGTGGLVRLDDPAGPTSTRRFYRIVAR